MNDSSGPPTAKPPAPQATCVLACSGCSRAGELADRIARRLQELGLARMSCLAGVGGRVKSIMNTVQRAPELLMIDGCPLECGANMLRLAGVMEFHHLKLHLMGVRKHETEVTPEIVQALVESAGTRLSGVINVAK